MAASQNNININLAGKRVVILADGTFPVHHLPLSALEEAEFIVCCDGAAGALAAWGIDPGVIIGDLDSVDDVMAERYADRLLRDTDQETNDLTKAVRWSVKAGAAAVTIVGATGKREDHTLGNISLLADYGRLLNVKMLTDTGIIWPVYGSCSFQTAPGQRVSVFSPGGKVRLTATGLEYPVNDLLLDNWWKATLNAATGHSVTLNFKPAPLIIYLGYR